MSALASELPNFLEVFSLAVPEVSSLTTLARCTTIASDSDEELTLLLEKFILLLEELNSLGEVLVTEGRQQIPPCALVLPSEVLVWSSLAPLQEGQKGLDHSVKALEETSRVAKVLLLATADLSLQVHQVVPG